MSVTAERGTKVFADPVILVPDTIKHSCAHATANTLKFFICLLNCHNLNNRNKVLIISFALLITNILCLVNYKTKTVNHYKWFGR